MESKMRRFVFERDEDVSGLSGTGVVVEGVEFTGGWVALTWLTPLSSLTFHPNIATAIRIHGHEGRTRLRYLDESDSGIRMDAEKKVEFQWHVRKAPNVIPLGKDK